jgi:hypothetical protein
MARRKDKWALQVLLIINRAELIKGKDRNLMAMEAQTMVSDLPYNPQSDFRKLSLPLLHDDGLIC